MLGSIGKGQVGGMNGNNTADVVRVVYRNYATLYFVFVVDSAESELGILDLIQVSRSWDEGLYPLF